MTGEDFLVFLFTTSAPVLRRFELEDIVVGTLLGLAVVVLLTSELFLYSRLRPARRGSLTGLCSPKVYLRTIVILLLFTAFYLKTVLQPRTFDLDGYQSLIISQAITVQGDADHRALHSISNAPKRVEKTVPSFSEAPGAPSLYPSALFIDGSSFKDAQGRTVVLRGVNLSGATKIPYTPEGPSWKREGFFEHRDVSFVGRPFPLEEADEHFARLRSWGMTFLRFLVTWEAIEHDGPGVYDTEYLHYVKQVVRKAAEYGISVFIDPHQDVFSRWTGGDGCPGWVLEQLGMNLENIHESGAAFTHQMNGDPLPKMVWSTNSLRLAGATLFTLFFAGNDFAPNTHINNVNVQDFLQEHFLKAMQAVAEELKEESNVVGFDSFNEPSNGWVGWEDISLKPKLRFGWHLSPFESMQLGSGFSQEVEMFSAPFLWNQTVLLNSQGVSMWAEGASCIWRENGVWDINEDGKPVVLKPNHFKYKPDGQVPDFLNDYMAPFFRKFASQIREKIPSAVIFIEPQIDIQDATGHGFPNLQDAKDFVWTPHWYDAKQLMTKSFHHWLGLDYRREVPVLGHENMVDAFESMMTHLKNDAKGISSGPEGAPSLIGEVGIAYDMREKEAFRTGDFQRHLAAADTILQALDRTLSSFTWWNYCSDNSNARGDNWNDEDLSIFSRDQQDNPRDLHSGGRALAAIVRPYPVKTAGRLLQFQFKPFESERPFMLRFEHDPSIKAATEIYVPQYQYPGGVEVEVSDGDYTLDWATQTLRYTHSTDKSEHSVIIRRKVPDEQSG